MKRRLGCGRGKYRPTNSRRAARAGTWSPSLALSALSPPSFAFDHAAQRLTAGGAAKLSARTATRRGEMRVTARALTAEKCAFPRWALALAGLHRACVGGIRCLGEGLLGGVGLTTLGGSRSISLALTLPLLPPVRGLAILPAGAPAPPSPSRGPAFGATVSGLVMSGAKDRLTSFEETPSLSRPTSPLTGPRIAASWCWAQGSCELPTGQASDAESLPPLRGAFSDQLSPRGSTSLPA
jgi:hypothetical protein